MGLPIFCGHVWLLHFSNKTCCAKLVGWRQDGRVGAQGGWGTPENVELEFKRKPWHRVSMPFSFIDGSSDWFIYHQLLGSKCAYFSEAQSSNLFQYWSNLDLFQANAHDSAKFGAHRFHLTSSTALSLRQTHNCSACGLVIVWVEGRPTWFPNGV